MRAMVLDGPRQPLRMRELPVPSAGPGQLRLRVRACGVCRTDLHVVHGELPDPGRPVIPGHEVVGVVEAIGEGVQGFAVGERVGVPWLGWTCGVCEPCRAGRENLCDRALFTGYTLDGGYAEAVVADARYCFPLPPGLGDAQSAPLLCAGFIGYRAWRLVRGARRVGLYGFGAAAHLAVQVARHAGQEVFAFTRPGDAEGQAFAREMGAAWAGPSTEPAPERLDAAILFAPVGALVPLALAAVGKGGTVVCAGIHMSDIPAFPYALLWGERTVCSVANLTRQDGRELLALAPAIPLRTEVETFRLEDAGEALARLRSGRIRGAAVVVP
jgi:alcohol dehydrogenase, propanol-preferring